MSHEQFRVLIFELMEHHLTEIEEAYGQDMINYHVERCRWAAEYLRRYTRHVEPNEQIMIERLAK